MTKRASLKDFIAHARKSDTYWVERAKNGFSLALERWRRAKDISNAELASKIDTSPAYITKVFRGDTNFTIETMVKLARACGGELSIQIEEPRTTAKWLDAQILRQSPTKAWKPDGIASAQAQTNVINLKAANAELFKNEWAA